jgi:hypothetical protein
MKNKPIMIRNVISECDAFDLIGNKTPEQIIEFLSKLRSENYQKHITLSLSVDGDNSVTVEIVESRLETKEEMNARIEKVKRLNTTHEQYEYATYMRLKEKFGNVNG